MCGIVGLVGQQEEDWIQKMNQVQFHRGPDDFGMYKSANELVSLGMRRLSIIDIEGGKQPMQSSCGNYTIVFNGEIFNAKHLREKIKDKGAKFYTSHSDTEVLLNYLIIYGVESLNKFNGMFSFCFYDKKNNKLLCARDENGIKPFFYVTKKNHFAFASEIKSLRELPFITSDLNYDCISDYISLQYCTGENTIFSDIKRLPAGHYLEYEIDNKKLCINSWAQYNYNPDYSLKRDDWKQKIREELISAFKRWTISDVPVALSLSGGLDSSALAGCAKISGQNFRAYSLGFTGDGEEDWNELPLARIVAKESNVELQEIILNPDEIINNINKMVSILDEPYSGGLPSWFIYQAMEGKEKVALTGTGGDELFGNYGKWNKLEGSFLAKYFYKNVKNISKDRFIKYFFNQYYYCSKLKKSKLLLHYNSDVEEYLYDIFAKTSKNISYTRDSVAILDFKTQLPDEFLFMTDRFSMAHQIEARTPFLDKELINLVRTIPHTLRTEKNDLKGLLRDSICPLVPAQIYSAPKKGFVIPISKWLKKQLKPMLNEYLSKDYLDAQNIFNSSEIEKYIYEHMKNIDDHGNKLWSILMFQLWYQTL